MSITNDYERIIECNKDDIDRFQKELRRLCEDDKKKIYIVMKYISKRLKRDESYHLIADWTVNWLISQNEISVMDYFSVALIYEKMNRFQLAIRYYEMCISIVSHPALRKALLGMKYRVYSKMTDKDCYYDKAIDAFRDAMNNEIVTWRREKWKEAELEMIRQRSCRWKDSGE